MQDDSVPVIPFFLMQGIAITVLLRMTSSFIGVKLNPIAMQMSAWSRTGRKVILT